jgi:hypothetical protein
MDDDVAILQDLRAVRGCQTMWPWAIDFDYSIVELVSYQGIAGRIEVAVLRCGYLANERISL